MATFNKFEVFVLDLGQGTHQLQAAGHTLEVYLTNATPSTSADSVKADLAEITNENGYTAPVDATNTYTETTGTGTLQGVSVQIAASGGTVGPFESVVLQNTTPSSPLDPLIGWWVYPGGAITLQDGETFDVKFNNAAVGVAGNILTIV